MKIMVIDGNSIINRAYHGIRPLSNHEGTPTNAVYGFLSTLFKQQDEERPDRTVVCFDVKEKTFRHLKFDTYKATRKPMDEELAVQMPIVKEVLDALGIVRCELAGYEADDLLGTISRRANENGDECVILTGDRDCASAGRRRNGRAPGQERPRQDDVYELHAREIPRGIRL